MASMILCFLSPEVYHASLMVIKAEVTSSNTVGYQKISLGRGFNMIGVQFKDIVAASDDVSITKAGVLDSSFAGFDDNFDFATTMMVWSNANDGYETYGWAGSAPSTMDPDYASLDNTWLTLGVEPTDDVLDAGQGYWVVAQKAGTITTVGEVVDQTQPKTMPILAGFNMVSYPWPQEVTVSTFCTLDSSFAGFDDNFDFATTMMVWSNANDGYETYGWAGSAPSTMDPDYASLDNTWLTLGVEPTEATIPAGAAVWIVAKTSGTATFTQQ